MKIKKIISLAAAVAVITQSFCAAAETQETQKIKAEEYEHLTTTRYGENLVNYHITTESHIADQIKGGEGFQIVRATAVSDKKPDYMIKGTDTSGIYYSHDRGESWHTATGAGEYCIALGFYPDDENLCFALFAGTQGTESLGGVYKSTDGGKTWNMVINQAQAKRNTDMDIEFGKKDEATGIYPIYIGNAGFGGNMSGVYKSTDKGESFLPVFESEDGTEYSTQDIWAAVECDTVIYLPKSKKSNGTTEDILGTFFVSENGGESWTKLAPEALEGLSLSAVTADWRDETYKTWLVAGNKSEIGSDGSLAYTAKPQLFKTTDGGETWSEIPGITAQAQSKSSVIRQVKYTYPSKTGEDGSTLFVMFGEVDYPLKYSFDDGETWQTLRASKYDLLGNGEKGDRKKKIDYYGTGIGTTRGEPGLVAEEYYITENFGKSWKWSNSGLSGMAAYAFEFDANGELRFAGAADMGAVKMLDDKYEGKFKPAEVIGSTPMSICTAFATDPKDSEHCFALLGATSASSVLAETFDGFETCTLNGDMANRLFENDKTNSFLSYGVQNKSLIYTTWYISEDDGKNWRESKMPVCAMSPVDDSTVYSLKRNYDTSSFDYGKSEVYVSKDKGKTWISTGIRLQYYSAMSVTADKFEEDVLWVGTHVTWLSYLYRIDLKNNSIKVLGKQNGLEGDQNITNSGLYISHFAQSDTDKNLIAVTGACFYGGKNYVFLSRDGGANFTKIEAEGLGDYGQCGLRFNPKNNDLYIGGHQGIWVYTTQKQ